METSSSSLLIPNIVRVGYVNYGFARSAVFLKTKGYEKVFMVIWHKLNTNPPFTEQPRMSGYC